MECNHEYEKARRTSINKFLKLIADPIDILSKKSWYIQALSKEFNITPTTTHHHMQGFLALELLHIKKEDNKVLYTVDKDKVKKCLDCLSYSILN